MALTRPPEVDRFAIHRAFKISFKWPAVLLNLSDGILELFSIKSALDIDQPVVEMN